MSGDRRQAITLGPWRDGADHLGLPEQATRQEVDMQERRIIGLDLGIASEHTAHVLTGDGEVVAKRKAIPTTESLRALEMALWREPLWGQRSRS
jgi:hypothetical protein